MMKPDMAAEVYSLSRDDGERSTSATAWSAWRPYLLAVAACAVTTLAALPLLKYLDPANIVVLFLLPVVFVAARLGRGPAILASFLSVALFDFFFVPPRFTFAVADSQYIVTFAAMLVVALVITHLTANIAAQVEATQARERRARLLGEMARDLAGATTIAQVAAIARRCAGEFGATAAVLVPNAEGKLERVEGGTDVWVEPYLARLALHDQSFLDNVTSTKPVAYYSLRGPSGMHAVLAVASPTESARPIQEPAELFQTMASLLAIALERMHFAGVTAEH